MKTIHQAFCLLPLQILKKSLAGFRTTYITEIEWQEESLRKPEPKVKVVSKLRYFGICKMTKKEFIQSS